MRARDYIDEWLGRADYASLPSRVRYRIRQQQNQSEILIGWVQLGVVVTFGGLYAVSPKTFTDEAAFLAQHHELLMPSSLSQKLLYSDCFP